MWRVASWDIFGNCDIKSAIFFIAHFFTPNYLGTHRLCVIMQYISNYEAHDIICFVTYLTKYNYHIHKFKLF